jgi:hypothetical protein
VGIRDLNSDGFKDVTATNTTGQNTTVTIDLAQNRNTNDLATSIGHEGSHVADGAALVGALPNDYTSDAVQAILTGPLNLTKYQTESAAYTVSATVSQGLRNARYDVASLSITSGRNNIEIWRAGWRQADQAAIDRVLAVPRNQGGLYGVGPAPNQQGQRLIPVP